VRGQQLLMVKKKKKKSYRMLYRASNFGRTFVMTSALKNEHVGGACVLQERPKYSHKRISIGAKANFSGITAGRMRRGWRWTSMDTSWPTQ
jgi:hypothetical protein